MRVGLTYNLKREVKDSDGVPDDFYLECDDLDTVEAVKSAILARHEDVIMIEATEDAYQKLRQTRPEMVFNMAEGLWGESRESQMPAIMEMLRIPYTGSSPLSLALCLNKARAKEILSYYGIPNPGFVVTADSGIDIARYLKFPLIVKPLYEGSSKGIKNDSLVSSRAEFSDRVNRIVGDYKQPALVEEYLSGREFTVALIGNGDKVRVLPIVEINYSSLPEGINPIYSYEAKWILDRPDDPLDIFACPADVDERLRRSIEKAAVDAFRALDVKDWCRIDVRLDHAGTPNIIELNPLPGILYDPKCNSCFPKAARTAGMDFTALINSVIDTARERYGI